MEANTSIDDLVAGVMLPLLAVAMLAFTLSVCAVGIELGLVRTRRSQVWRWSPAPRSLRRLVFAACGVSLAVLPAVAASGQLAEPADGTHGDCRPRCHGRLEGLQLPDLPSADPEIVVRPGSCLWTIAGHRLGSHDTESDILRFATRLYHVNQWQIGPNPDLIYPGTHLTAPEVPR